MWKFLMAAIQELATTIQAVRVVVRVGSPPSQDDKRAVFLLPCSGLHFLSFQVLTRL